MISNIWRDLYDPIKDLQKQKDALQYVKNRFYRVSRAGALSLEARLGEILVEETELASSALIAIAEDFLSEDGSQYGSELVTYTDITNYLALTPHPVGQYLLPLARLDDGRLAHIVVEWRKFAPQRFKIYIRFGSDEVAYIKMSPESTGVSITPWYCETRYLSAADASVISVKTMDQADEQQNLGQILRLGDVFSNLNQISVDDLASRVSHQTGAIWQGFRNFIATKSMISISDYTQYIQSIMAGAYAEFMDTASESTFMDDYPYKGTTFTSSSILLSVVGLGVGALIGIISGALYVGLMVAGAIISIVTSLKEKLSEVATEYELVDGYPQTSATSIMWTSMITQGLTGGDLLTAVGEAIFRVIGSYVSAGRFPVLHLPGVHVVVQYYTTAEGNDRYNLIPYLGSDSMDPTFSTNKSNMMRLVKNTDSSFSIQNLDILPDTPTGYIGISDYAAPLPDMSDYGIRERITRAIPILYGCLALNTVRTTTFPGFADLLDLYTYSAEGSLSFKSYIDEHGFSHAFRYGTPDFTQTDPDQCCYIMAGMLGNWYTNYPSTGRLTVALGWEDLTLFTRTNGWDNGLGGLTRLLSMYCIAATDQVRNRNIDIYASEKMGWYIESPMASKSQVRKLIKDIVAITAAAVAVMAVYKAAVKPRLNAALTNEISHNAVLNKSFNAAKTPAMAKARLKKLKMSSFKIKILQLAGARSYAYNPVSGLSLTAAAGSGFTLGSFAPSTVSTTDLDASSSTYAGLDEGLGLSYDEVILSSIVGPQN